jgi:hypothetical protein
VNKKDLSLFIYDENQDMLNRDSEVLPPKRRRGIGRRKMIELNFTNNFVNEIDRSLKIK